MQTLKRIPYVASLVLLAYMPLHIFLSQWLSTYTGGLEVWKIGKDVLLLAVTLFTICLVWWQGKGNRAFNILVGLTTAYAAIHLLLWTLNPSIYSRSAEIGIIYNMRLPLFAVLGFGAHALYPRKFTFSLVIKVVLYISTIVASLGVLQYFLPSDLLTHFGYGIDRGVRPAFYIDNNTSLPMRVISTLREPNALGAYLVLPTLALFSLILRIHNKNKGLLLSGALAIHLLALLLTQSRSAIIGLFLGVLLLVWWQYRAWVSGVIRRFWLLAIALAIVISTGLYAIRNTAFFESYIVHSNQAEQVEDLDSNDYHTLFIKRGLEGVKEQPLGHGPGTAGLASIQNPRGSFLTENYYIQIGYELGVVGLGLFITLNVFVYLWVRRCKSPWAPVILASFWAYVATNMLLHTWSNEAVAAQWWILAGAFMVAAKTQDGSRAL